MAGKKGKKQQEGGGLLSGIPLGSALEVAEGVGAVLVKLAAQRYEVDKKVERIKQDTEKRVEELNQRFADWYYVIDAASFDKLHKSRADLVGPKQKPDEPDNSANPGLNLPGMNLQDLNLPGLNLPGTTPGSEPPAGEKPAQPTPAQPTHAEPQPS